MSYLEQREKRGRWAQRFALFALLGFLTFLIGGLFWATATPGKSYDGTAAGPEDPDLPARLERHVRTLAKEPRSLNQVSTILSATTYLTDELEALGYSVRRQEVVAPADNLIVQLRATNPNAPLLIVGAHYDTAGASPGADDNASGVAALLELARGLKPLNGRSSLGVQLVLYANEEPPYFKTGAMGSYVHALSLDKPQAVVGMIALESMGYFSDKSDSQNYPFPLSLRYPSKGNFIAFVGPTNSRDFLRETLGEFRKHARIPSVGGTAPSIVQGIDWSDHWGYGQVGIPAFMVTDTAPFRNPHYHRKSDTPDTLDFERLALVVEALEKTLKGRLNRAN